MALDIYVGSLTRFYRREWENVVEKRARLEGVNYQRIYAGGPPAPAPSWEQLQQEMERWWEALGRVLGPHGVEEVRWDESPQAPYFTDRPNWICYSCLLLWAAYEEHPELQMPGGPTEDFAGDPAYRKVMNNIGDSRYPSLFQPELWLPVELPFVFSYATPDSDAAFMGSIYILRDELKLLRRNTAGLLAEALPDTLGHFAGEGLAIFESLCEKACEHRLPMRLSY